MNRRIASFSGAAGIAILLGMGVVWNEYLHTPPVELHQLPSNLIALDSPAGQALLAEGDAIADYDELRANFVAQSRKSYCGVASAVMVLNAAHATDAPLDQRTIFANPSVDLHPLEVSFRGMSLLELGGLLRAHGVKVTVVRASNTDVDAFRREIRENLSREGDYLLINYEREYLGQAQSGHISPIAAYHVQSDRLLVLDVAANKYPPAWVRVQEVWEAMSAPLNAKTSTTRGFIVISATRLAHEGIAESGQANLAKSRAPWPDHALVHRGPANDSGQAQHAACERGDVVGDFLDVVDRHTGASSSSWGHRARPSLNRHPSPDQRLACRPSAISITSALPAT